MFKKRNIWFILIMLFDLAVFSFIALIFGNEPWMKWYKDTTLNDGLTYGGIFLICHIFIIAWLAELIPYFGKWWNGLKD